ncbi:MAG: OmpH family outer membrane protein [Rikenellaceae bacterium]
MKKIFTGALFVALLFTAVGASAQKMGRVNVQGIVVGMPEMKTMQKELETIQKDFQDNLETMQVELNNKFQEFQQTQSTMNASVRSLKEKDMQDLSQRMQQFEQSATQEIQRKQNELLQPILQKAKEAIAAEAKAGSYVVVYDESLGALAYFDEAAVTDLTPAVKTRLGVQ